MKAICIPKPWDVVSREFDKPQAGAEQALIQVKSVGICGSDLPAFRGSNPLVSYPRIIGHEVAGEIVSIPGNNPQNLKPGDRVIVDPYLFCGICYPCSIGRTNCCTNLQVIGVHVDGGMCEYLAHPAHMLHKLPDTISWDVAPIAEPLTIALHGIHRGRLAKGEHIAIFGAGPIGLLATMVAVHYGAIPTMIDVVDERLKIARQLGAAATINPLKEDIESKIRDITRGHMCQVVMEASGATQAVLDTLKVVSHAGRVVLTGWPKEDIPMPTALITKKEIDICGSRTSAGEFAEAIALIADGKVNTDVILTETISLDKAPEMLRQIEREPGRYLKVHVLF